MDFIEQEGRDERTSPLIAIITNDIRFETAPTAPNTTTTPTTNEADTRTCHCDSRYGGIV